MICLSILRKLLLSVYISSSFTVYKGLKSNCYYVGYIYGENCNDYNKTLYAEVVKLKCKGSARKMAKLFDKSVALILLDYSNISWLQHQLNI